MRTYHCNGCNKDAKQTDNERLVVHICGSGDVDRICPKCRTKYEFDEQEYCKQCRAEDLAKKVCTGEIGLVDAILNL